MVCITQHDHHGITNLASKAKLYFSRSFLLMSSGIYIRPFVRIAKTIVVWTISVFILIGVEEVVGSSPVSSFLLFIVTTRTGPRTNTVRDGLRTGPYGTPYGPVRGWSVRNGVRTGPYWPRTGPRTESVRAKTYPYVTVRARTDSVMDVYQDARVSV